MDVREVMSSKVTTIEADELVHVAAMMMREEKVGCLVVVDGGRVWGIITDRDIIVRCFSFTHDWGECEVWRHATKGAITITPDRHVLQASRLMMEHQISRVPVVEEDGGLVGLVSLSDIAVALDRTTQATNLALHDLLMGMGAGRAAYHPHKP